MTARTTAITAQRATRETLARRLVREEFTGERASTVVQALVRQYADDVPLVVLGGPRIEDPIIEVKFPRLPLWDALERICALCGARMAVDSHGVLVIRALRADEIVSRQRAAKAVRSARKGGNPLSDLDNFDGGALAGQSKDIDGTPLAVGDAIEIAHMDDTNLAYLVGVKGVIDHLADDHLTLSAALEHALIPRVSTFNAWVRKLV